MFDLRPADGAGSGEHVAGRHRAAPEPGVYRDVAVHTGAHRLLESEDLPSQGQGDYRRGFRTMAQSGTAGLLTNDKRERRQTIYRLEFDFHAIRHREIKTEKEIFSTNKPIGNYNQGIKREFRLMTMEKIVLRKTLRYIRPIVLK